MRKMQFERVKTLWRTMPIKTKLTLCFMLFLTATAFLVIFTFSQTNLTMQEAYAQENDYYNINSYMNTFIRANQELEDYLRHSENKMVYQQAFEQSRDYMRTQLNLLNLDINEVGVERYLLARAMTLCAIPYNEQCDKLLEMGNANAPTIELYAQYAIIQKIAKYMELYTRQLLSAALSEGQIFLADSRIHSQRIYDIMLVCTILLGCCMLWLLYALLRNIVTPVLRLAAAAKDITNGNFDTPDVIVTNKDEIYSLAKAFNRMKTSMKNVVEALKQKSEMEQQLHQRELEAMESQQMMEQAKMQQLRSQINPHFLFNTLNIISRTARSENAPNAEKLILALSRLFRYGLKTDDKEVPLAREIHIVEDYLSIQKTRFGNRVNMHWRIASNIDLDNLLVPAFLFQPIVENAIIHGIEPKVDGGTLRIRIHRHHNRLIIIISDNGIGMSRKKLKQMMDAQSVRGDLSGIGVGNVRSRLLMLNENAVFKMHSKQNYGTSVFIAIPLE